ASSSLICAAAVAAAEIPGRDAWRLAGALCAGAFLWLDRPGVAERSLGLQSAGLAVPGRAWCVVDDRRRGNTAAGGVAHSACACRPVSALRPVHCAELADQAAGSTNPARSGEAVLRVGQVESRSSAAFAFFGHRGGGDPTRAPQLARSRYTG